MVAKIRNSEEWKNLLRKSTEKTKKETRKMKEKTRKLEDQYRRYISNQRKERNEAFFKEKKATKFLSSKEPVSRLNRMTKCPLQWIEMKMDQLKHVIVQF